MSILQNNIAELSQTAKDYFQVKVDLVKLMLLKKVSNSLSFLLLSVIIILLFALILTFAGAAFIIWYGATYQNYLHGALFVVGFLILVALVFIIFRKKILTSIIFHNISNILFDDNDDE